MTIQSVVLTIAISLIGILFAIYAMMLIWFVCVTIPIGLWNLALKIKQYFMLENVK